MHKSVRSSLAKDCSSRNAPNALRSHLLPLFWPLQKHLQGDLVFIRRIWPSLSFFNRAWTDKCDIRNDYHEYSRLGRRKYWGRRGNQHSHYRTRPWARCEWIFGRFWWNVWSWKRFWLCLTLQQWRDSALQWDALQYKNVSWIYIPLHELWMPDLVIKET